MFTQLVGKSTQPVWVVVDANVDDYQTLVKGVLEGAKVFVLDTNRDGVEQIAELFETAVVPPQSLHIVSHGAPGTLQLGNSELSLSTLKGYTQQVKSWAAKNILLYGCNVAAGDAGEEFMTQLNTLTGASIAASTTLVGSAGLGGNWHLDATTHDQPAELAITPEVTACYSSVLADLPDVNQIFTLNGAALRQDEDEILLVPDAEDQSGDAFSTARIDFNLSWDFTFELFFGNNDNGADGIGFVLHNDPAGANAEGDFGEGLGIAGVENSIAIEFDTFQNSNLDDPTADHTAFILDPESDELDHGKAGNEATNLPNIEDGAFHEVVVSWNANTNTLSYTFDGNPIDSITRDVINADFGGEDLIFWGFGASTGNSTNEHRVRVEDFNGRLVDPNGNDIINTDPNSGKTSSGPMVFQFNQFVRFEEIDEGRPYQGNNAAYSEEVYLLSNPDVKAAVDSGIFTSGFQHFSQFAASEGRSPLPLDLEIGGLSIASLFDETYYLSQNPDIAAAVANGGFVYGYEHFVHFGIDEGRDPSYYYDEALYLTNNTDVQAAVDSGAFSSGLEHYLQFGHIENRVASELFDPDDYLLNNPDIAAAVSNGTFASGFDHYIEFGAAEGRLSTLLYEEAFYLQQNTDVAAAVAAGAFQSGFDHYISFGQGEGRDPGPLFDESVYLDCNPDVAAAVSTGAFSSGMEHYFRNGRHEGRIAVAVA